MPRHRHVLLALVAAPLVAASSLAAAQTDVNTGRYSCSVKRQDIDLRIAGDQATVAVGGATRTLKRQEAGSTNVYADGTSSLRYRGRDIFGGNAKWVENGLVSAVTRCAVVEG
ncbi:MAG: hypothetical protein ABI585_03945 [Betaproteobacteria bacterium]